MFYNITWDSISRLKNDANYDHILVEAKTIILKSNKFKKKILEIQTLTLAVVYKYVTSILRLWMFFFFGQRFIILKNL